MFKFEKVKEDEVDAKIFFNGNVITGRHSRRFTHHLDSNVFLFPNDDELGFDFYEVIKNIPIRILPNRVEFLINNIHLDKMENPIQDIPYPFNVLMFLKLDDVFYTQVSSFTDDAWDKKWAVEYYFSEFQKIIDKFPNARIREEDNEEFSEGRLRLEISDTTSLTIGEAFVKAMPAIEKILTEVDNSLSGFGNLLTIIEAWKINKYNRDESFWQELFTKYPQIISQLFSHPIILFQEKAYLGGKSIQNKEGKVIDYAFKNNLTNNLALIEIKTPQTTLIGSEYRNSYSLSYELTGSINQLLQYRDSILKEFYSINHHSEQSFHIINPKSILLIGSFDTLNKKQREVFEMFRNDFKTIDIVTFDELFDKIYILLKLLQA